MFSYCHLVEKMYIIFGVGCLCTTIVYSDYKHVKKSPEEKRL